MESLIRSYRRTLSGDRRKLLERFRFVDAARKVVGVGSVGTRAWIILMLGRDNADPLFLQAKEAQASVLEPFLGKSEYANHGQRVVEGQRLMQAASDIMLGWIHIKSGLDGQERDFYLRQLWDAKGSARHRGDGAERDARVREAVRPDARKGRTPARGTRSRSRAISGRAMSSTGRWPSFAESYADQNERDYDALKQAVDSGRVKGRERSVTNEREGSDGSSRYV